MDDRTRCAAEVALAVGHVEEARDLLRATMRELMSPGSDYVKRDGLGVAARDLERALEVVGMLLAKWPPSPGPALGLGLKLLRRTDGR